MSKISPGMVEAGINAMAHVKRASLGDEAAVARIFADMDGVRRREEARKTDLPQKTYQHQAWPKWCFGPDGESRVFNAADEVPEGWTDEPRTLSARVAREAPAIPRRVKAQRVEA